MALRQVAPAFLEFAHGGRVGLPVALARGLEHALHGLRQRVRVLGLEPVLEAEVVLVAHVDVDHLLPLVVAHDFARGGRPAPEVVGGVQHLQRARVALLHQALDVAGVELARGQLLGEELRRTLDLATTRAAQVADVELGRLAVEVPHGQRDAAQVLEGVVGGQHAVEVGAAREHRALGAAQVLGVEVDGLAALGCRPRHAGAAPLLLVRPIGELHLGQIQLGELLVALGLALPGVGGERRVVQPGAVAPALRGKDARGAGELRRLGIGALGDESLRDALAVGGHGVVGLVPGAGRQQHRLGQLLHDVGEMVAVQAGGRQHHVHARAAQPLAVHQLHAGDAPALVPHGLDAEQPQGLGLEHAEVAHGLHRPEAEGELLRLPAVQLAVLGQHVLGRLLAGLPGLFGGDARGVEAIEVAARGIGVGVLDRVAAVGGSQVAPVQHREQALELVLRADVGIDLRRLLQCFL